MDMDDFVSDLSFSFSYGTASQCSVIKQALLKVGAVPEVRVGRRLASLQQAVRLAD
jgi:hypothetical protein